LEPYAVGGSGLQLVQVAYNRSAARWDIDISFTRPSDDDAVVALYLPRAQHAADGTYTADFNSSFEPRTFPCSTANLSSRAATSCCLADFAARYHVVSTFSPRDAACVPPYNATPPLPASDAVSGGFGSDMPMSAVAILQAGSPAGVRLARVSVAEAELRSAAAAASGVEGLGEVLETFVGLAQFAPTPTRILDSAAQQVSRRTDAVTLIAVAEISIKFTKFLSP
jgi:hypothetical protein